MNQVDTPPDVTAAALEPPPAVPHGKADRAGLTVALQSRDLIFLTFGQVVSQMGDSFLLVSLLVLVRTLTTSPLTLAGLIVSAGLPTLLFGLFAGVVVDRFDRRMIMLLSDTFRGVIVLGFLLVTDASHLPLAMVINFFMGVAGVVFIPARAALMPHIVVPLGLVAANMLVESTQIISIVIGPALASYVIDQHGQSTAIIIDSMTFFLSAACIWQMSRRNIKLHDAPLNAQQLRHELLEGLSYIRRHHALLLLIAAASASQMGLGAVIILGTIHIQEVFGVSASGIGALLSILGMGMVLGGAIVATPYAQRHTNMFVLVSTVVVGISLTVFPFLPVYRLAVAAIFITGVGMIASRSVIAALTQMAVPTQKLGRVDAAGNMVISLAYNASLVATGALGLAVDRWVIFLLAGVLSVIAGVLAFRALQESQMVGEIEV